MQGEHPSDPQLRGFHLRKLDPAASSAVRSHLEGCRECRSRLKGMMTVEGTPPAPARGGTMVESTRTKSMGEAGAGAGPRAAAVALPSVPDYEVVRLLGEGGMGAVYLARHEITNRVEALKVLSRRLVDQPRAMERFLREVQAAVRLEHRNIVRAYTAIRCEEGLVLAMEYIEGENLEDRVARKGPLPVVEACFYALQAAQGLQHIHEKGMVHRDIKPQNLMLDVKGGKGLVKILDAGLAKATSEGPVDGGLTRHGAMLGTADYIAPEQIRDAKSADIRADIYSLGCTLYFLLNGQPPFAGKESLYDIFQAHHSQDPVGLDAIRTDVPADLAALVNKMMAKDASGRFQMPTEVAAALRPFIQPGATATDLPVAAPAASRRGATLVEAVPLADALGSPSRPRVATLVQDDAAGAIPARLVTLDENPIRIGPPKPRPAREEPTPAWKRPAVLATLGAAVVVTIAAVGAAFALRADGPADPGALALANGVKPTPPAPPPPAAAKEAPRPQALSGFGTAPQGASSPPAMPGLPTELNPKKPNVPPAAPKIEPARPEPAEEGQAEEKPDAEPDPDPADRDTPPAADPPASRASSAVAVGADGLVRVDFARVAADPAAFAGKRVLPDGSWKVGTRVYLDDPKGVPGYGSATIADASGRPICDAQGKPKRYGLGIAMDLGLARELSEYFDANRKRVKDNRPAIATVEVRRAQVGGVSTWLAVVVDLTVMDGQDEKRLANGDRDGIYETKHFGVGSPLASFGDKDLYARFDGARAAQTLRGQARKAQKAAVAADARAKIGRGMGAIMNSAEKSAAASAAAIQQQARDNYRKAGGR